MRWPSPEVSPIVRTLALLTFVFAFATGSATAQKALPDILDASAAP